jgi:glutathione S-transferase
MVLFLKSEAKELALTVFPVNMKNPEPEFKEYHAAPPVVVLVQENIVLTDNLRIEQYINSRFTSLDLTSDKEAESVCSDVYIKFNAYLKAVDQTSVQAKERQLLIELKRINDYLDLRGTTFLSGNEMTLVDCDVMPKLQHIRVAGKVTLFVCLALSF